MNLEKFAQFLSNLGYPTLKLDRSFSNCFSYSPQSQDKIETTSRSIFIDYLYCKNPSDLFDFHLSTWNENKKNSFIAVFDSNCHIIDARQKPDKENPLSNRIIIESFEYGVNTPDYDLAKNLELISKDGIDSTYYFNFVSTYQKRRKASEVDEDLLLNLLALRNDLVTTKNEEVIHLLLLRCLFVKYLEDRGVFENNYLHDALNTKSPDRLLSTFKKVRKINGDLFKTNELRSEDIKQAYLDKLTSFFGYTDYRTKQGKFFPYKFDKIPIQLISNIYESFLRQETKKDNGVYYTPAFLVTFILEQTVAIKSEINPSITVLDPACGSGVFLVESFKLLIKANKAQANYNKKKAILQKQLFGIDLDYRALQIAAFSLYLALLEGEESEFIKEKIRTESPILPTLVGKTLVQANALVDNVQFFNGEKHVSTFDCIVANPPWGSVPDDADNENIKTRDAIANKSTNGEIVIYKTVSDFQRSQAFLLKSRDWSTKDTIAAMVVNNSIFLNGHAHDFRKDFLGKYLLQSFYELTDINKILFKKRRIGELNNRPVEVGANEPCCVVIYQAASNIRQDHYLNYITPSLNQLSESLELITYGSRDIRRVKQQDLIDEDLLWRVFVNGSWEDYQLIKKRILSKDERIIIECRSGFQPQNNMRPTGKADFRKLIKPSDFIRYHLNTDLERFNWSQTLRRRPNDEIFNGKRILIPIRPLESDELRFRAIRIDNLFVHTHNILSIKIKRDGKYVDDYRPYLAILNSKYLGYHFYQLSSQWGKGSSKRSTLRNVDIEALPFPKFQMNDNKVKELSALVSTLELSGDLDSHIEDRIDDLVFDLYELTQYERALVNEFYQTRYSRKQDMVRQSDFAQYSDAFLNVFNLFLKDGISVASKWSKLGVIGAAIGISLQPKSSNSFQNLSNILHLVKRQQTGVSYFTSVLKEEKVKFYDKENHEFYIVKSAFYRDWTERQAIDDANEEINSLIKHVAKHG